MKQVSVSKQRMYSEYSIVSFTWHQEQSHPTWGTLHTRDTY